MEFKVWLESSFNDLYRSSVEAFPHTTLRQHATNPIKITKISWLPFLGVKTLFVKGLAQNENREYSPIILFKNVKYHESMDSPELISLHTEGKNFFLEKLSLDRTDILVRCQCGDFYWRGNYADHLDKSLYVKKRNKYESLGLKPAVNPTNSPMLCKHLMKLVKALSESGIISQ